MRSEPEEPPHPGGGMGVRIWARREGTFISQRPIPCARPDAPRGRVFADFECMRSSSARWPPADSR